MNCDYLAVNMVTISVGEMKINLFVRIWPISILFEQAIIELVKV